MMSSSDPILDVYFGPHVKRYRAIVGAMLGLGSIPPLLDLLAGIGSPWPDRAGCAYATTLVTWVMLLLAHGLWSGASQTRLKRLMVATVCVGAVSFLIYLMFYASFVVEQPSSKEQIVIGFGLKKPWSDTENLPPDLRKVIPPNPSILDLLKVVGWDAFQLWPTWTVVFCRVGILVSWVAVFGSLSGLTSAYISLLEVKHKSAAKQASKNAAIP